MNKLEKHLENCACLGGLYVILLYNIQLLTNEIN